MYSTLIFPDNMMRQWVTGDYRVGDRVDIDGKVYVVIEIIHIITSDKHKVLEYSQRNVRLEREIS